MTRGLSRGHVQGLTQVQLPYSNKSTCCKNLYSEEIWRARERAWRFCTRALIWSKHCVAQSSHGTNQLGTEHCQERPQVLISAGMCTTHMTEWKKGILLITQVDQIRLIGTRPHDLILETQIGVGLSIVTGDASFLSLPRSQEIRDGSMHHLHFQDEFRAIVLVWELILCLLSPQILDPGWLHFNMIYKSSLTQDLQLTLLLNPWKQFQVTTLSIAHPALSSLPTVMEDEASQRHFSQVSWLQDFVQFLKHWPCLVLEE